MTSKNYLRIPLLLLTIGLLTSCSSNNDWKKQGLNGKVKTFLELLYKPEKKFGEWDKGIYYSSGHRRLSFDNKGNLQLVEYLDKYNDLDGKVIFKRENGAVIEQEYYDSDGELTSKTKYISNSKDEREYITYNKDGEKIQYGKSYFENSRIIKVQTQLFEDKVEEEVTFLEYDQDGNLLREKSTDKKGEITYFRKYEYLAFDDHKNWTKRLIYVSEESEEPLTLEIREYKYY